MAEGASGAEIRLVHDLADLGRLSEVFSAIWGLADSSSVASTDILRAITHAGGYAALAVGADGAAVGGSLGFRGVHHHRQSLHSHITGVMPSHVGTGLGRALKMHQRQWAIDEGLDCITWTFDPLVRRNARFNIATLGAQVEDYLVDFYGPLGDDINGDDASDRLLAVWNLADAPGRAPDIGGANTHAVAPDRSTLVLVATRDDVDGPLSTDPGAITADVGTLLVATPNDIVSLRRRDRATADTWRHAVRAALVHVLAAGWVITAVSADGSYVLQRAITEGEP